jgi:thiol-disulfide isomerase/thioredoxin
MTRKLLLSLLAPLALALAAATAHAAAEAPVLTGVPKLLPELRFVDMAGAEASLADFRGEVVVLNLWATWCAPCREEMPGLDRLAAMFAGQPVRVLALSVDRAGPERVQAFLDEVGVRSLGIYRDPKAAATRTLKVPGLPATLLVDRQGREAGRVLGIARWDGDEAVAAVRQLLEEEPAPRGHEVTRAGP